MILLFNFLDVSGGGGHCGAIIRPPLKQPTSIVEIYSRRFANSASFTRENRNKTTFRFVMGVPSDPLNFHTDVFLFV